MSWVVLGNAQVCSRLAATSVPAAAALLQQQWLRESSTVKSAAAAESAGTLWLAAE